MGTLGYAGRVGVVMLLALVLFGGMWAFFAGGGLFNRTYTFDVTFNDARGVTKDVPVQLAGVQIGTVDQVRLVGQRAVLRLRIKNKYRVPRGSRFAITTSLLSSTGVVTVIPPADASRRPNDVIRPGQADLVGERTGDLTASLDQVNALLGRATVLVERTTQMISDPRLQGNLQRTISNVHEASANVNAASANGLKLTRQLNQVLLADNAQIQRLLVEDNAQIQGLLRQTRTGTQAALGNITDATAQLRATTRENRAQINAIVANVKDTTEAVAGITGQTNDLLKNGDVTKNLAAAVANLKATTDKLNATAGNVQSLTGDAAVQANLRETVQNIRDSSEQAKFLLERLNKLAGTKPRTASVVVGPGRGAVVIPPAGGHTQAPPPGSAPLLLPRADLLQNTRSDHFRADVDAVVPFGAPANAFARAGIYGLGDTNKLILQYGKTLGRRSLIDYRYGLYASKLSVGGDYGLGRNATFSFDLYDPNRVQLDARGVLMLSDELGLVIGAEDITRRGGATLGLELRR